MRKNSDRNKDFHYYKFFAALPQDNGILSELEGNGDPYGQYTVVILSLVASSAADGRSLWSQLKSEMMMKVINKHRLK